MAQHTLLIADDHRSLADSMSRRLAEWYRVLAPVTSLHFLTEALDLTHPDIVLLDLDFGTESSVGLIPDLVKANPSTRFVVFTGLAAPVLVDACLMAGAHGFVSKLADPDEIHQAIESALVGGHPVVRPVRGPLPPSGRAPRRSRNELDARKEAILWLLQSGFTQRDVAERLGVSPKTVEYHAARSRAGKATPKPKPGSGPADGA
jgi:DNA-binding NarL/FixJ family response regulator